MDNDLLVLIRLLLKKTFLTTKEIEKETGSSRRQILYRIEKINHMLEEDNKIPIHISNKGDIIINPESKKYLKIFA